MGKKNMIVDPMGKMVPVELAVKRWRRIGKAISEELGLGPLMGWDPGICFYATKDGKGTVDFPPSVYRTLYLLCLEVQKLRRLAKVPRDKDLQKILDEREEALLWRKAERERQKDWEKLMELHAQLSDPSVKKTKGLARKIQRLRSRIYAGFQKGVWHQLG